MVARCELLLYVGLELGGAREVMPYDMTYKMCALEVAKEYVRRRVTREPGAGRVTGNGSARRLGTRTHRASQNPVAIPSIRSILNVHCRNMCPRQRHCMRILPRLHPLSLPPRITLRHRARHVEEDADDVLGEPKMLNENIPLLALLFSAELAPIMFL